MKTDKNRIDVSKLSLPEQERVARALTKRNHVFSITVNAKDAEAWRRAAEKEGVGITFWAERAMNAAAKG